MTEQANFGARVEMAEGRIGDLLDCARSEGRTFSPEIGEIADFAARRFAASSASVKSIDLNWADWGNVDISGVRFGEAFSSEWEVITANDLCVRDAADDTSSGVLSLLRSLGIDLSFEQEDAVEDTVYRHLRSRRFASRKSEVSGD